MAEYDANLEKAIDDAGRLRVFARARELGWSYTIDVPKFVWWSIIHELRIENEEKDQGTSPSP